MSKPKVLIFARREEPPETIQALEGLGCEIVFGKLDWQMPRGQHEDAVVEAARDAVALMGTSIRHTPITRRIMQASQRLRVVAKYTVGVDDIDTEAATDLGVMVCHAPTEVELLRRRRDHGHLHARAAQEAARARRRRARRQMARAGEFRLLRRQPAVGRLSGPDHRPRRARPHRHAGGATAGALARAHHRLRSLCAAGAFPHPRRRRRSTTRRCCANPTWCRSTSCSPRRRATCSARSRSS